MQCTGGVHCSLGCTAGGGTSEGTPSPETLWRAASGPGADLSCLRQIPAPGPWKVLVQAVTCCRWRCWWQCAMHGCCARWGSKKLLRSERLSSRIEIEKKFNGNVKNERKMKKTMKNQKISRNGFKKKPKGSKWKPKGTKMEPKGTKSEPTGAKKEPKRHQGEPKGSQREPK